MPNTHPPSELARRIAASDDPYQDALTAVVDALRAGQTAGAVGTYEAAILGGVLHAALDQLRVEDPDAVVALGYSV